MIGTIRIPLLLYSLKTVFLSNLSTGLTPNPIQEKEDATSDKSFCCSGRSSSSGSSLVVSQNRNNVSNTQFETASNNESSETSKRNSLKRKREDESSSIKMSLNNGVFQMKALNVKNGLNFSMDKSYEYEDAQPPRVRFHVQSDSECINFTRPHKKNFAYKISIEDCDNELDSSNTFDNFDDEQNEEENPNVKKPRISDMTSKNTGSEGISDVAVDTNRNPSTSNVGLSNRPNNIPNLLSSYSSTYSPIIISSPFFSFDPHALNLREKDIHADSRVLPVEQQFSTFGQLHLPVPRASDEGALDIDTTMESAGFNTPNASSSPIVSFDSCAPNPREGIPAEKPILIIKNKDWRHSPLHRSLPRTTGVSDTDASYNKTKKLSPGLNTPNFQSSQVFGFDGRDINSRRDIYVESRILTPEFQFSPFTLLQSFIPKTPDVNDTDASHSKKAMESANSEADKGFKECGRILPEVNSYRQENKNIDQGLIQKATESEISIKEETDVSSEDNKEVENTSDHENPLVININSNSSEANNANGVKNEEICDSDSKEEEDNILSGSCDKTSYRDEMKELEMSV